MVPEVIEWSFQVFLRHAAMMPPTVPMTAERIEEIPTRANVAGMGDIAATKQRTDRIGLHHPK